MIDDTRPLRTGFTTGSCATAATAAALDLLLNKQHRKQVDFILPDGSTAAMDIIFSTTDNDIATAGVRKFAGDDPDITAGALISASVRLNNLHDIRFFAGDGVGTITRPGLQIPVGEPAINPVPRRMLIETARKFTSRGIDITLSVENGKELAAKTFNPRLGIVGGISIIGTSGIVRPFSHEAIQETVRISIDVAAAAGVNKLILVAGHYGMRAAKSFYNAADNEIIEVSNEWDTAIIHAVKKNITRLQILSHPGKLVKFSLGYFNTHSKHSPSALLLVQHTARELNIPITGNSTTVEGLFQEIPEQDKFRLASILAANIKQAVIDKYKLTTITVTLIDMQNHILASTGDNSK